MPFNGHPANRRGFLKLAGATALATPVWAKGTAWGEAPPPTSTPGLPPLKITDVRVIVTCPSRNFVLVKIMTSEPGLYGVGDATLNGQEPAVAATLEKYMAPLLIGHDPEAIEDTWQFLYRGPYFRGGPIQMSALAGVDTALWDIKGKRAGMPVYQLLGGRTRLGALAYIALAGHSLSEVEDSGRQAMERGFRCFRTEERVIPGLAETYGAAEKQKSEDIAGHVTPPPDFPYPDLFEPEPYLRTVPKMIAHLREKLGEEVGIVHDVHGRLTAVQAARLAKELEPYHLFYLEDPVSPEYKAGFRLIRQHSTTPLAMGELFNSLWDCADLIKDQLIDYIRCDLGHFGGITNARKVAALAESFQVRTAWHGPGDIGPPTHAANVHMDLTLPNFGIQEMSFFPEVTKEVVPGGPEFKDGYLMVRETPGIGTDVNEELAKKYPYQRSYLNTARHKDGSVQDW